MIASVFRKETGREKLPGLIDYSPFFPVAAAAAYGLWKWTTNRKSPENRPDSRAENPYRSPPAGFTPTTRAQAMTEPRIELDIPGNFRRMVYGPMTVGDNRLDTELVFEKQESGWSVCRASWGRSEVSLSSGLMEPRRLYPVRNGDVLHVNGRPWTIRIEET